MTRYFTSIEAVNDEIADLVRLREKMQFHGAYETRAGAERNLRPDLPIFSYTPRGFGALRVDLDTIALEAAQRIHTQSVAQIQIIVMETIKRYFPGH